MYSRVMAPYRKHQKVKKQDTDGLLHHNDAMTSALVAELYYHYDEAIHRCLVFLTFWCFLYGVIRRLYNVFTSSGSDTTDSLLVSSF